MKEEIIFFLFFQGKERKELIDIKMGNIGESGKIAYVERKIRIFVIERKWKPK